LDAFEGELLPDWVNAFLGIVDLISIFSCESLDDSRMGIILRDVSWHKSLYSIFKLGFLGWLVNED